tara:strand:- start:178 stop:447 length:270 start_codon:yes stop_codon:yes gene_type:complete
MYINPKIIFKNNLSDNNGEKFFCELCGFPLVSHADFSAASNYNGVCQECYLSFVESRRKEWKDGWRPDKETLEEYIYKRKDILLNQERK